MFNKLFSIFASAVYRITDFDRTRTLPQSPPDGKHASYLSPQDRLTIRDRSLKGFANVPVVAAICMRIIAQAVGRGMLPSYMDANDTEFSKQVTDLIRAWSTDPEQFDAGGRLDLTDYQRLAVASLLTVGELFTVHRQRGSYGYSVQCINSNSVQGSDISVFQTAFGDAVVAVHDGVALDKDCRALAYSLKGGGFLTASNVSHTYDASREANAYRGLPFAWTSVNSAIDLHEITADATGSAKMQSRFAFFRTGRKNKLVKTKSNKGIQETQTLDSGSPDGSVLATDLSRVLGGGGAILDVGDGEDIKPMQLPSATDRTLAMMDVLAARVCLAYGFAPQLILDPGKIGGTGIRAVLSQAEKSIIQLQTPVVRLTKTMVTRFLAAAVQPRDASGNIVPGTIKDEAGKDVANPLAVLPFGFLGKPLPLGFQAMLRVQLPSTLTVDYGRDTKANLELLNNGQATERDLQEAEGRSWEEVQDQRIAELRRSLEKCKEAGIPYELYRRPQAGAAVPDSKEDNSNTENQ